MPEIEKLKELAKFQRDLAQQIREGSTAAHTITPEQLDSMADWNEKLVAELELRKAQA